ncbi:hypothetical protein H6G33_09710 [Calothrix sp. FACHB-1219]|uniref:hypothetical protein n=1 Tax=unclassified Calothrix TaxID=2619626 RepID=UPI001688FFAB|nr:MULTISPECIES: hypothetical protein [unclassified Calothrix]MBD2201623.1 hypothetical protein [Calothrix sp. FACHB-168]MBD2217309.1 hypothetical protein [Calothrix sp. FACHB-1219]
MLQVKLSQAKNGLHIISTNVLMIDIDCKGPGHKDMASISAKSRAEAANRLITFSKEEQLPIVIYPTRSGVHCYLLDRLRDSRDAESLLLMTRVGCDANYIGLTLLSQTGLWNERISPKKDREEFPPIYGFQFGPSEKIHPLCQKWIDIRGGFISRRWKL